LHCSYRFTTQERIERKTPLVVKRDGSREPFDREKILRGLQVACRKRTITLQQMEESTDRVEQRVYGRVVGEVKSSEIGRMVLDELRDMDLVGYLRFASVYQEVQNPGDFLKLLSPWLDAKSTQDNEQ
jgi:transcriptional repressor NrdR